MVSFPVPVANHIPKIFIFILTSFETSTYFFISVYFWKCFYYQLWLIWSVTEGERLSEQIPKGSRVRENKCPFFTPISQMIPREVLESPRILPQDALLVTVANTMGRCFIQFVFAKGWSKSQFQPIAIFYLAHNFKKKFFLNCHLRTTYLKL